MTLFLLSSGLLLLVMGCVTSVERQEQSVTYYVSPNGNDAWSGQLASPNGDRTDGPFGGLERARDAIRSLRDRGFDGGVTVFIRGGTYYLEESLQLSQPDSGAPGRPVTYRNYKDEDVRLIGGKKVGGFVFISDPEILARIAPEYQDKILCTNLRGQGISDFGEMKPRGFGRPTYPAGLELFFDGEPMTLARWPSDGWVKIAGVPNGKNSGQFMYSGDRPKRWTEADDVWVHGYWTWDWADSYERVESIDTEYRIITTREPHGVYGYKKDQRFYYLNILEELDRPGEWYLDRQSGYLYFWPPKPLNEADCFVSILEEPMISMENTESVRIEGVTLECTRGNGVEIHGGARNVVAGCVIRNIGNIGVVVDGGTENGVTSCDIYEVADGGVNLSGGDRRTLTEARNFVRNTHFHDFSRWCRTYRPAVRLSGVGNHIVNNLIHDAPHMAIGFSGNDHLIQFNEIHHVCWETGDVGAAYIGRDWTERGNIVRHNFFHHIYGPLTHGAMSVYLDDAASGTTIYGNVFYQASRAAFIGGGRDNTVENNIFVDCKPSVHIDARGLGWAKEYIAKGGGWHMYDKLERVNHDEPPYGTRYPKLADILDNDPAVPLGNRIIRNVSVGGEWLNLQGMKREWVDFDDNLVDIDPHFVDPENMNFQLEEDSPAYKLGFQRIPMECIGLYEDKWRGGR